jgi:tetratricopeptide (TPR) repeat protein
VALAACASILAFSGSLGGDFVYDDTSEIVSNPLIQQPRLLAKALVSDTWTFRAASVSTMSNYWRPVRTLGMAAGYWLFGIHVTFGWHVAALALHLSALAAALRVLTKLGSPPALSGAILVLAAVHPTRVESVVWISGFQDLLVALFLLWALGLLLPADDCPSAASKTAACALFALALLSKESAIAFPAVVFVALLASGSVQSGRPWRAPLRQAAARTVPFVVVAALYLGARKAVLGVFGGAAALSWEAALLTLPSQLAFYFRHALFPFGLGPLYPLRPVLPGAAGFRSFWLPALLAATALAGLAWLTRRSPLRLVGLALFLFLLAPALPAFYLSPERIVQDRYLYLPLLGLFMVLVPAAADAVERTAGLSSDRAQGIVLCLAIAAALPLGRETARYGQVWGSEASLWARGVETDPSSAFALGKHASWLFHAGRLAEAKDFATRALAADAADVNGLVVSAWVAEGEDRQGDAARLFARLLEAAPGIPESWDWNAAYYERRERPDEAVRILRGARERLPLTRAAFTDDLALVLHRLGRTGEALAELESVRPLVAGEFRPAARLVPFHIGVLALELGRVDEARGALLEFVAANSATGDPELLRRRERASEILRTLPPAGP